MGAATGARLAASVAAAALAALLLGPGQASAATGHVDLFRIDAPESEGGSITPGPDGALWFTEGRAGQIGRITTEGQVSAYPLPFAKGRPGAIAAGPDGNLWFSVGFENSDPPHIARIAPDGQVSDVLAFPEKASSDDIGSIVTGPDGGVWFTQRKANLIGRLGLDGQLRQFATPTPKSGVGGILIGPDGNLWFLESAAVARISTSGEVTEFPLPKSREGPRGIAVAGGAIWVSEYGRDALLRVATDGRMTELPLPAALRGGPEAIVADRHGDLWLTGSERSLTRVTRGGAVTQFTIPYKPNCKGSGPCGPYVDPVDVTAGPDGAIWFLGAGGPGGTTVGRVDPDAPPPVPVASVRPSLHGRPAIGERITARTGTWSDDSTEFAYRWQLCDRRGARCVPLHGQEESFLLTRDQLGHTLRAVLTARNGYGATFLTTAPTDVVAGPPPPLRVGIESARLRSRGGRRLALRVSCLGGAPGAICSGRVMAGLSRRNRAALGVVRYRLGSGHRSRVLVRVGRGAIVSLRLRHRVLVTATLWGGRRASRRLPLAVGAP